MIGAAAAIISTSAFLPQVIKVVKTRETTALSLGMYVMQMIGFALWAIHGYLIADWAVLCTNIVTMGLGSIILGYKLRSLFQERHKSTPKEEESR